VFAQISFYYTVSLHLLFAIPKNRHLILDQLSNQEEMELARIQQAICPTPANTTARIIVSARLFANIILYYTMYQLKGLCYNDRYFFKL